MSWDEREDTRTYKVVINHEEQYSIWPADRENPLGWNDVGKSGSKQECLDYIEQVWTDMRPLSLRKHMEEVARKRAEAGEEPVPAEPEDTEPSLVDRLAQGEHPVEASLRPERTVKLFKDAIDRGYVHIKFTGTRGGTELGVRLENQETDLSGADFDSGTGTVHLVGRLVLDYVPVRCVSHIALDTLAGTGHLERVEAG